MLDTEEKGVEKANIEDGYTHTGIETAERPYRLIGTTYYLPATQVNFEIKLAKSKTKYLFALQPPNLMINLKAP